jgi:hypothetical protein
VNRPIGARDPFTAGALINREIPVDLIGCATLTLPRFRGPRSGELHLDDGTPGCLTNRISSDLPWQSQWEMALVRIEELKRASLVHTRRLHVILPCLAMGTPVIWEVSGDEAAERFSILSSLGLPASTVIESFDAQWWADNYRAFIAGKLNISIMEQEPACPA